MKQNSNTTIRDIARQAGVSKSTVSMVMNGSSKFSLETSEKVLAVIQKLQYKPSVEARKLAQRRWRDPAPQIPRLAGAGQGFRRA
jgi:DNA-binding LacI/PurR family transcriptional regulator